MSILLLARIQVHVASRATHHVAHHGVKDKKVSTTAIAFNELAEDTDKQITVRQLDYYSDRPALVACEQRGQINNKPGWEDGRVKGDFLEDTVPVESPEV